MHMTDAYTETESSRGVGLDDCTACETTGVRDTAGKVCMCE